MHATQFQFSLKYTQVQCSSFSLFSTKLSLRKKHYSAIYPHIAECFFNDGFSANGGKEVKQFCIYSSKRRDTLLLRKKTNRPHCFVSILLSVALWRKEKIEPMHLMDELTHLLRQFFNLMSCASSTSSTPVLAWERLVFHSLWQAHTHTHSLSHTHIHTHTHTHNIICLRLRHSYAFTAHTHTHTHTY